MRQYIVMIIILLILCLGLLAAYAFRGSDKNPSSSAEAVEADATTTPKRAEIGRSVEGREIIAYTYGSGEKHLLFVGGIHGGYEWNTVVLAYMMLDHLYTNPEIVPANISVTIIPSANPDGVYKVIGKEGRFTANDVPVGVSTDTGRFNAHEVDLNRNFACKWQPESMWKEHTVSAGTAVFSEPEAIAIRDFVLGQQPEAVVFWHSKANAVFASECEDGVLPETLRIAEIYAQAAEYPTAPTFDEYEVTGDAEGWLASIDIPAITVELSTHEVIEWEKNLAGVKALFAHYSDATPRSAANE